MKIIYTTGVYDLFHIGHLNLLRGAKALGDYLVVGVSTDEFVESYKGKKPVIPFEDRFEIIKAIKYVDEVIVQNSKDKIGNMMKVQATVFAVGSDWRNKEIMGGKEIWKKGGVIFYLPYTDRISTTILKDSMENHGK